MHRLVLAAALIGAAGVVLWAQPGSGLIVPAFGDFAITTRTTFGEGTTQSTTTLYLRGGRERRDTVVAPMGEPPASRHVAILQCDQRRAIHLNLDAGLFAETPLVEWSNALTGAPVLPEPQGPIVTTTEDAVDTGERRRLGRYVARRVKTTTVVSPAAGANTLASRRETDGWYIDVPGLGCVASEPTTSMRLAVDNPNGPRDRHRYEVRGTARRGYAIEETIRHSDARMTHTTTVSLVDWSDAPLDPSLFETPASFRPALPLPAGGVDLTKPDSVVNRLQAYWDAVTSMASRAVAWSRGWH